MDAARALQQGVEPRSRTTLRIRVAAAKADRAARGRAVEKRSACCSNHRRHAESPERPFRWPCPRPSRTHGGRRPIGECPLQRRTFLRIAGGVASASGALLEACAARRPSPSAGATQIQPRRARRPRSSGCRRDHLDHRPPRLCVPDVYSRIQARQRQTFTIPIRVSRTATTRSPATRWRRGPSRHPPAREPSTSW